MKNTVFIGSGFSVPAGLPTMSQFGRIFQKIYNQRELPTDEAPWLDRLDHSEIAATASAFYYAEKSAAIKEEQALNIEWILAQLEMLATLWNKTWTIAEVWPKFVRVDNSSLTIGDCYAKMKSAILKVYRDPMLPISCDGSLAKAMLSIRPQRIVTTNYDRVAETVLDTIGKKWFHRGTVLALPTQGTIDIIKLHGDTLWEQNQTRIWGIKPECRQANKEDCFEWAVQPVVLPTWIRERPSPSLQQIWREASNAITNCDHLIILGFGLPNTDQHVGHLLSAGLCGAGYKGEGPRRITIVNPKPDAVDRILEVIPTRLRSGVIVHPVTLEELFAC